MKMPFAWTPEKEQQLLVMSDQDGIGTAMMALTIGTTRAEIVAKLKRMAHGEADPVPKVPVELIDAGQLNPLNARIVELQSQNKSAPEIAAIIGNGLTRNAVIGRMHRMKLPKKDRPIKISQIRTAKAARAPKGPGASRAKRSIKIWNVGEPTEPEPMRMVAGFAGVGISLLDVGPMQCRWPYDERLPGAIPQCCGDAICPESPYCLKHSRAAFTAPPQRHRKQEASA